MNQASLSRRSSPERLSPPPKRVSTAPNSVALSNAPAEEWVSKKKTEVTNTKQIETRVKRQVVLEDGKVVEDSGPLVTTNTTEDTETQEHHQTEVRLDKVMEECFDVFERCSCVSWGMTRPTVPALSRVWLGRSWPSRGRSGCRWRTPTASSGR